MRKHVMVCDIFLIHKMSLLVFMQMMYLRLGLQHALLKHCRWARRTPQAESLYALHTCSDLLRSSWQGLRPSQVVHDGKRVESCHVFEYVMVARVRPWHGFCRDVHFTGGASWRRVELTVLDFGRLEGTQSLRINILGLRVPASGCPPF